MYIYAGSINLFKIENNLQEKKPETNLNLYRSTVCIDCLTLSGPHVTSDLQADLTGSA